MEALFEEKGEIIQYYEANRISIFGTDQGCFGNM